MKVSTRADYACRAMLSLALNEANCPLATRELAERTGLPQPYLEQIFLSLKGAGLVTSKRGVGGGHLLARPASQIALSDIVGAVEGPIIAGEFAQPHTDGACNHEGRCVLLSVWGHVGDRMSDLLSSITLADVAQMANGEQAWLS